MANYSREEAERQGKKASIRTAGALLVSLGGLAYMFASGASNDRKRLEETQKIYSQMIQKYKQLADLNSGLGRWLHAKQISDLENEVAVLKQKKEKLK